MDDLKVRITLGDTTLEGTLDELLESGTFKMEYDHAGLNKIVQEAVALQRAEYQKDPQHYHCLLYTSTEDGIKMLKNGILKEQWGQSATNYIDDLLTDLQTTQRKRSTTMTKVLDRLRGNYAGAILTLNPGVAIAQAASLPTAGAVLGADTMAAVVPFVKNLSGKQDVYKRQPSGRPEP